jgi:hypothetical protein
VFVARFGWAYGLYLRHFSKPKHERIIHRWLHKQPVSQIVELGIGGMQRSTRVINSVRLRRPDAEILYAGIDRFESRPADHVRLKLKDTYQTLAAAGAKVRLIPGDPEKVLSSYSNVLTQTDLLIVSAEVDAESLARAWFYVPRMLKRTARVFVEVCQSDGRRSFQLLSYDDVSARAEAAASARRAAA